GRTDWQEEVATLNGVNIPLAAYHYELGLPLPTIDRPRRPVIWTYTPWYWFSVFESRSFRDSRPPGCRVKSACWRLDDPVPFAIFCLEWLWMLIRKLCRTAIAVARLSGLMRADGLAEGSLPRRPQWGSWLNTPGRSETTDVPDTSRE